MKWRYSRRMTRVRCILVDTTVPVKIRPRMETSPVKGHFLSAHKRCKSNMSKISQISSLENPPPTNPHVCILVLFSTTPTPHPMRIFHSFSRASHTDVRALNGSLWCPEAQTDFLVPSPAALADLVLSGGLLVVGEDVWLLLESALTLDS